MRLYLRMQLAVAVVCMALGVLYIVQGLQMPSGGSLSRGGLGPGTLPTAIGVVMAIASGVYFLQQWRLIRSSEAPREGAAHADRPESWSERARRSPVLVFGLVALYLLLVPWVGFFTLTAILLIVMFTVVDVLTWPLRLGVTVIFVAPTYLLFDQLLRVPFPIGYVGL